MILITAYGSERVAVEAIVRASSRADGPYVKFNCAALPRELAEAELFGHSRGAFTGATAARSGLFRQADVRVLAASNRDLAAEVSAGRFRQDLYYRLDVVQIEVPPLRDRPEDVAPLARHFAERFGLRYGLGRVELSAELLAELERCHGNQSQAARRLEVSRPTLIDKMKKHGLR